MNTMIYPGQRVKTLDGRKALVKRIDPKSGFAEIEILEKDPYGFDDKVLEYVPISSLTPD